MKTIAAKEDENPINPAFKAVIIYDDIGYAARAAASLERAAVCTAEEIKYDVNLWRLDFLRQPTQDVLTMAVAADANLIVFALNETHPPLEELLNWLEHWSANRRVEDAAVTLLGPEAGADTSLRNELERFARRRGLAFLDARETRGDQAPASGLRAEPPGKPPGAREILPPAEPAPAPSHWGIND